MRLNWTIAAVVAAITCTSLAHASTGGGGGNVPPADDPDPSGDTWVYDPSALGTPPAPPAGSGGFVTSFNGMIQGGFAGQPTPISQFGQVFTATAGTLDQLTFADTNSTNSGVQLVIQAFDPNAFATTGGQLYASGGQTIAGLGDGSGANGRDAFYYHTFSNIGLGLTAGQQYYAYLTATDGGQVFNGSTSLEPSHAYFFLLASIPTDLGGTFAWRQGDHYYTTTATPYPGTMQALYSISITPNAQSAAPEPASWAMMVGGFGLIGGAMRRRRRATVSFA